MGGGFKCLAAGCDHRDIPVRAGKGKNSNGKDGRGGAGHCRPARGASFNRSSHPLCDGSRSDLPSQERGGAEEGSSCDKPRCSAVKTLHARLINVVFSWFGKLVCRSCFFSLE